MIILMMGVSGAGKSTLGQALANRLGYRFVEGDEFHPLANVEKMRRGEALEDQDRWPWLARLHDELLAAQACGEHLVLACSALKVAFRRLLLDGISASLVVYLEGAAKDIAPRLQRPGHFMPPSLLDSQLETLEPPDRQPSGGEPHLRIDATTPVDQAVQVIVGTIGAVPSRFRTAATIDPSNNR